MSRNEIPHPTCSGICNDYHTNESSVGGRYTKGQKRCQMCLKWIYYDGVRCPCCNYRLRTRTRSKSGKEKLDILRF